MERAGTPVDRLASACARRKKGCMSRPGGYVALSLVGAAVCTVCDMNHVRTGTLGYTEPFLFGQAWWVAPNFALVFLLMGAAYAFLSERFAPVVAVERSRAPGDIAAFVEATTLFAFVYLTSGFANEAPDLLSLLFFSTFLVRLAATYERAWLLLLAVLMAVGGMAGEGALGAAGLVAYRHADVFHVPLWLGGLYLHGAFSLREGMRFLVYR
jgi:hypothetical protein